ncbi:MAG: CcmD family protein [Bacteroidetes bacterium]|nr:CcmD family protein [Bacteroidota bacterium]
MRHFNKFKVVLVSGLLLFSFYALAQNMDLKTEEPTDFMHSNGKIFVVMVVVITIVTGLLIYVINLDRKIRKLEKNILSGKV